MSSKYKFDDRAGVYFVTSTEKISKGAGFLGYVTAGMEITSTVHDYKDSKISGERATYRVVGTVTSALTPIIYGAVTGSEVGPEGTVAGILVGTSFVSGEIFYDHIYNPLKNTLIDGIDNAESSLRSARWPY